MINKFKLLLPTIASFVPLLGTSYCSMSVKSPEKEEGLTLFYHQHSFYAKKVMLTLEEKKLPYTRKKVQLIKNEQYEPWFIAINPKGEVPVLKDGTEIIIDSKKIIDYLEDNFSTGDSISLASKEADTSVRENITELRRQIDAFEGNLIGFGFLFHPDYIISSDRHYPYNLPGTAYSLKKQITNMSESLKNLVNNYPHCKDVLLRKAENAQKTFEIASSKDLFDKEVSALKALLAAMEQQLGSHPPDWWLCSESFSQADVSLAILMDRIWRNGAADYFWSRHPHLGRYFHRIQGRESYKAIEPTFWDDFDVFGPIIGIVIAIFSLITGAIVAIPLIRSRLK